MRQENNPDASRPDIFFIDIDEIESNRHCVLEKSTAKAIEYPDERSKQLILKIFSQVARIEAPKVVRKGEHYEYSNQEANQPETAENDL
jgi:hypothetical protein